MKYLSATIFVCAALAGCAGREQPTNTPQPSRAQTLTTTGATIPVEAPNPKPDPFNTENAAPIRSAGEPAQAVESEKDHAITNRVRQRIAGEPTLRGANLDHVTVTTHEGHVLLEGWVPSMADKVTLEQRAREAQGVIDVRNEIVTMDAIR